MESIEITFIDGSKEKYPKGITPLEIAEKISEGLKRDALYAIVNGKKVDMTYRIEEDATLKIVTPRDDEWVEVFRHSTAHLLAQAVCELFPDALPTIGPVVEEGFYYDFYRETPFKEEDIEKIEKRMKELVKAKIPIERVELSKEEALKLFQNNKFKVEMINELEEGTISAYRQGDFIDLCRGPHIQHTGQIKAFKILKIAGAYWRGDAKREQLQRIYGISFPDKKMLKKHLAMLEEAKKRDHRKLGALLDLFSFHEEGPGFPFWHPKGVVLMNEIIDYWRGVHKRYGYVEVKTPIILNESLWHRSGHWDHYKNNMYFTEIDGRKYAIKPMNCPGGLLIYNSKRHSYRELPLRIAELGLVHRHELSGVLHGLFRVRAFTQDDAHIYCMPEQMKDEIIGVIELLNEIYTTFGFTDYEIELSTRPEDRIGSDEIWDIAEGALEDALKTKGLSYKINPGDGAFYGPKIDFHIKDSMNRRWQCGTIQVDFSMPSPERFNALYEGKDGKHHTPVMIHRAILGSLERFIGILIEHYAGKLPLWLNPEQVRVLPISEKLNDYGKQVMEKLDKAGIRVYGDFRNETLQKRIRDAQLEKVNYQLIVGEREREAGTVNVRTRNNERLGEMKIEDFIEKVRKEIEERRLDV